MNSLFDPASLLIAIALTTISAAAVAATQVPLSSLDLTKMRQGYGKAQIDRSIREKPLAIGGIAYAHGVGTHAVSTLWVDLAGGSDRFTAWVGVDDNAGQPGTVVFKIYGDGKKLFDSGVMKFGGAPLKADVDLHGVKTLLLLVGDAGDGINFDHADWAEAAFTVSGASPHAIDGPVETAEILTPKPPAEPRINGPRVYGCRPGSPFLYRIPATGVRPMTFSAMGLPQGLALDPASGILTGAVARPGEYNIQLKAANAAGFAERPFRILCGNTLALSPPMGWNHWYAHYDRITDQMVRRAAVVMVSSGMADVGYQYVNIDDCWMNAPHNRGPERVGPLRDGEGNVLPNKHFPDMKALTDFIHTKGLKAGLYTSPGPLTCGGFTGAYEHEAQDARRFSDWGFDFLKYDWCSYGEVAKGKSDPETLQQPYRLMGSLLKQQSRDIVFNLCQYGMGNVWEWGEEVGGECWRTGGDLGFELDRIFDVALKNAGIGAVVHPGAWNDPDYLQIGYVGDARTGGEPRPCGMTPTEQYSFMSLWCLLSAPLIYSGDMEHLDDFTLNVLCNPEVIAVDQDSLGHSARPVQVTSETFVLVKELEDGSKAVGLCNRGEMPTTITADWLTLGLRGKQVVRDLWRQKDLGVLNDHFQAEVPRHGVVLVKLSPAFDALPAP